MSPAALARQCHAKDEVILVRCAEDRVSGLQFQGDAQKLQSAVADRLQTLVAQVLRPDTRLSDTSLIFSTLVSFIWVIRSIPGASLNVEASATGIDVRTADC